MNAQSWRIPTGVAGAFLFGLAYYLLGVLSYLGSYDPSGGLAAWWAPSGLALAVLVRSKPQSWPPLLVAIFGASTAINVLQPITLPNVLIRSLADIAEPLTATALIHRRFGRPLRLRSAREVFGFAVFGGWVGPAVGAAVAGTGTALFTAWPAEVLASFTGAWWGSAVLGAMLFAPPILTWRGASHLPGRRRPLEVAALCVALVVVTLTLFLLDPDDEMTVVLGFATFPLLAWAAVRFGPQGAALSALAISLLSIWPYVGPELGARYPVEIVAVQSIYALGAFTALVLAGLTTTAEDLRVRAEEHALRAEESLALLETALRTAPFAIAFLDRSLRFSRINDTFASLGRVPQEDALGRPMNQVLPPEVSARLGPMVRSVLEQGRPLVGVELQLDDAPARHWLCSVYPVRARRGPPAGVGLLLIDVTERISAEQERARLLQEAKEAIQVREDFLSIASHELKTPLTPLAVRLHLMRRKAEAGEQVDVESIDRALKSVRQLTELINDLLDATRIAHGRLELHRSPQPLGEIVRESAEPFRDASPRHRLEVETPPKELWVNADRPRLGQVIANLIDNAIKYSPGGGTVRLEVQARGESVEVRVRDEGIGISPEHQARLFERFHRAPEVNHHFGGLGLGLYISRDIVERHGGRMWAESEPGRGSTFHVELPLIPPAQLDQALH